MMIGTHNPDAVFRHYVLKEDVYDGYHSVETKYPAGWGVRLFYSLENAILELPEDEYTGLYKTFQSEVLYYARNKLTGEILTNVSGYQYDDYGEQMDLDIFRQICGSQTYYSNYGEYVNGTLTDAQAGYPAGISRFDTGSDSGHLLLDGAYKAVDAARQGDYEIAYAFPDTYYVSSRYEPNYQADLQVIFAGVIVAMLGVLLFFIRFANRQGRHALAESVAKPLRVIPLEIKLAFLGVVNFFAFALADYQTILFLFLSLWFTVYLFSVDVGVNKALFYQKSICYGLYTRLHKEKKPGLVSRTYHKARRGIRTIKKREQERLLTLPYQKRLHKTLIQYVLGMLGIILAAVLLYSILFILVIPPALLGLIALSYWFYKKYAGFLDDTGRIAQHVRYLRGGNFDQKLVLQPESKLLPLAEDLNNLQDGLQNEIEKRMVSEKMKVELITNVSHDLKTPLTSIINYIDLLKEEELRPEFANDYVKVLDSKSKRLKSLIENIFDISKATSGNMPVHYERLSMADLVNQTLAECEDSLEPSNLSIKKNFTDEKYYVRADGKMLWRVTENIINNAGKYSLPGTRIYLELSEGSDYISFTAKNIAGYEMNFTADAIVERFVRGDESRTTAGTGLGLSIIKSFTEAMGGKMNVSIDGDLFKITICIKKYQEQKLPPANLPATLSQIDLDKAGGMC